MADYSKEELDRTFCKLIFSENNDSQSETTSKNFSMFLELIIPLRKQKRWHIPYDLITETIYDGFSVDEDKLKQLPRKVGEKFDSIEKLGSLDQNEVISCRDDTVRHINLAIHQKQYIDRNLKRVNRVISKTEDKLKGINSEAKNTSIALKKIRQIKDSIYSDFIAILGIFTAITFATFGGLQLIGNIFGKVSKFTFKNIGGVLMLGSIYLLGMYLILIALLVGVSKLNNRKYYLSNTSVCVLIVSFLSIFTFGLGLLSKEFSIKCVFRGLLILLVVIWGTVLIKVIYDKISNKKVS